MNSNQFRIRTAAGDFLPVQADGMSVHDSGALMFANMDANGNPAVSVVISPYFYQRVEALGPAQQPPQQAPQAPNRATRRAAAKKKA